MFVCRVEIGQLQHRTSYSLLQWGDQIDLWYFRNADVVIWFNHKTLNCCGWRLESAMEFFFVDSTHSIPEIRSIFIFDFYPTHSYKLYSLSWADPYYCIVQSVSEKSMSYTSSASPNLDAHLHNVALHCKLWLIVLNSYSSDSKKLMMMWGNKTGIKIKGRVLSCEIWHQQYQLCHQL